MDINILEEQIEEIKDTNLYTIFSFIIEAVSDFPLFDLNDTEKYFEEVKRLLKSEVITLEKLNDYYNLNPNKDDENNIWVMSSITNLLHAFDFMKLYNISFDEVQLKIKELNQKKFDPNKYCGLIKTDKDALEIQKELRNEWE